MREIKFRGKSDLFGWVYGSFALIDGHGHIFEKEDLTEDGHHIRQDSDRPTWVDENTIGQYTGLKDATGKEIYEGDIISNDKHPYKHLIYYDAAEACFMAKYGPGKDDSCRVYKEWINICHKQVIGNIHDNPELEPLIKIESKEE